jgi:hypothetical protein
MPFLFFFLSLDETPPDMGRKAVTRLGRKRGEKGIRIIGDMGFAMEELLFDGRRLFHHPRPGGYHYMVCHITTALSDQILTYLVQFDSS